MSMLHMSQCNNTLSATYTLCSASLNIANIRVFFISLTENDESAFPVTCTIKFKKNSIKTK